MSILYEEPTPKYGSQDYQNKAELWVNSKVMQVSVVGCMVALIFVFESQKNYLLYYLIIQILLFGFTYFFLFDEESIRVRLPINWLVATAFGAAYFAKKTFPYDGIVQKMTADTLIGVLVCTFIYWIASGVIWTARFNEENPAHSRNELLHLVGFVISVWALTTQISFFILWVIKGFVFDLVATSTMSKAFISVLEGIGSLSLLGILPASLLPLILFLFGMILMVIFRLEHDPFEPWSRDFFVGILGSYNPTSQFLESILMTVHIPVWLVSNMALFIFHIAGLFFKSMLYFFKNLGN